MQRVSALRFLFVLSLVLLSLTGIAMPVHQPEMTAVCVRANGTHPSDPTGLGEVHHRQSHDAVLSGVGLTSCAASLNSGNPGIPATGQCNYYCSLTPHAALLCGSSNTLLRRWHLLAVAVRQEQLQGLYPAHAFW